ncbi:hypothetical protein EST38_g1278 [Candolleomyces aberdarensis]|uniref:Homeobox domain-containing protein n=1 Tax=Candolleomyces aberdarensis TaxID=2316362 RepID=A0A4Q2DVW4_9AGAR|nr:hypothetical protein EST38_g1278 [Candolleomyces aberdarensis]
MASALLDDWPAVHLSSSSPAAGIQHPAGLQQKKPRHRHSPEQLAALNELFDRNEHPPLEQRAALAERLGMETKTVNAWFQNKRASSKKRTRNQAANDQSGSHSNPPPVSIPAPPPLAPPSAATTPGDIHPDLEEDEQQHSVMSPRHFSPSQKASQSSEIGLASNSSSFFANPDLHFGSLSDSADASSLSRKMRMRPTAEQTEELKKLYHLTPHPTSEERQALAERIGMRSRPEPYQLDALKGLFTRTSTPTIEERSALALEIGMDVGKVTNWFRNLRQTARKRNNRHHGAEQSTGSGDEDDGDMQDQDDDSPQYSAAVSRSASRAGTPSLSTSSSSSAMGLDGERYQDIRRRRRPVPHSNIPSDDEYPEAVTPDNGRSPSPVAERLRLPRAQPMPELSASREPHGRELYPPPSSYTHHYGPPPSYPPPYPQYTHSKPISHKSSNSGIGLGRFNATVAIVDSSSYYSKPYPFLDEDPITCAETAKKYGINLEDAYLLLDFHRQ